MSSIVVITGLYDLRNPVTSKEIDWERTLEVVKTERSNSLNQVESKRIQRRTGR